MESMLYVFFPDNVFLPCARGLDFDISLCGNEIRWLVMNRMAHILKNNPDVIGHKRSFVKQSRGGLLIYILLYCRRVSTLFCVLPALLRRPNRSFHPEAYRGFQYVSKITDQFTKWTVVYLLAKKSLAFDSFHLFITSVVIPCGSRVIRWRADKGGEYTGEAFKQYCVDTGITQDFTATNSP